MPQTATLEAPAAAITVPAPRAAVPTDPNAWAAELTASELQLALALSDMPRTRAVIDQALGGYIRPRPAPAPRELTPAGKRALNAWVVQGVERAGGLMALWESAHRLREFNRTETWGTPESRSFAKRFGGIRRLDVACGMAWHAATTFLPVKVRIHITDVTEPAVRELGRRYTLDTATRQGPYEAVYTMRRHHARLVAEYLGMELVDHVHGGYVLV